MKTVMIKFISKSTTKMAKKIKSTGKTQDYIIEVDTDTCIGCGTCEALAPKTFKIGKDMKSSVQANPGDNKKNILEAAQSCAVDAIKIIDRKTGKKLHP